MSDENEIQSPAPSAVASESPAVATTTAETPASTPSIWDTADKVASDIAAREPIRGPDGKFQPKLAAEGANGVEVPGSPQAAPPDPQPEVIEAPQSLPADVKGKWSTLPPDVQKAWAAREGEMHKKFTADGERLKALEEYEGALADAQEFLKQNGVHPAEFVRRMTNANRMFLERPQEAMQWLAQTYPHLGLNRLLQQPGAQPDPNSAMARELAEVKSQLNELTQSQKSAVLKAATDQINAVRKDMPYFDEVEPLMVKLHEPGMDLKALYDKAVRAHDDVYAKVQAEEKAAAEKKAADEAKARAEKDARLAPLSRKPGSTATAPIKGKNIWDTMDRVASEVRAR